MLSVIDIRPYFGKQAEAAFSMSQKVTVAGKNPVDGCNELHWVRAVFKNAQHQQDIECLPDHVMRQDFVSAI